VFGSVFISGIRSGGVNEREEIEIAKKHSRGKRARERRGMVSMVTLKSNGNIKSRGGGKDDASYTHNTYTHT
jgi:hypothetical protein